MQMKNCLLHFMVWIRFRDIVVLNKQNGEFQSEIETERDDIYLILIYYLRSLNIQKKKSVQIIIIKCSIYTFKIHEVAHKHFWRHEQREVVSDWKQSQMCGRAKYTMLTMVAKNAWNKHTFLWCKFWWAIECLRALQLRPIAHKWDMIETIFVFAGHKMKSYRFFFIAVDYHKV